jgi:hypothetical protein
MGYSTGALGGVDIFEMNAFSGGVEWLWILTEVLLTFFLASRMIWIALIENINVGNTRIYRDNGSFKRIECEGR